MDAKEVIKVIRDAVTNAERQGVTAIDPESLKALLTNIEGTLGELSGDGENARARIEQYKAQLGAWNDRLRHQHAWELENFRSVLSVGQAALKSIVLINGGAAVALLAFIGHAMDSGYEALVVNAAIGATYRFVLGVLAAAIAMGTTYLTQYLYSLAHKKVLLRIGIGFHIVTMILVIAAYLAFFLGIHYAYVRLLTNHV